MNMLILNTSQAAELAALNATGDPDRQLTPVPLTNGNTALPADLLTDCAEGQTWEHYSPFLNSLDIAEVAPTDLVEPQIT
jgi:hypothetical protein